jgi:threonyl-tRNA synthetase
MDAPFAFTQDNLAKIEAEMRKICKEKIKLERFELPRAEALKFMEEKDEPYKVELINDLPADASSASISRATSPTSAPARISIPPAASRATASS